MNSKLKEVVERIKTSDKTLGEKIDALIQLSEIAWSEGDITAHFELTMEVATIAQPHAKQSDNGTFPRFFTKERIGEMNFQLPDID
jgi:hypothetical protein